MQIFIIIAAVIIIGAIQLILQHRQAGSLTAEISPDTDSAEPDEKFHVIIRITNPSRIIYPFVRFGVMIPSVMTVHSDIRTKPHPPSSVEAYASCVLWPKRTMERRIEVSAPERGNYRFGNFYIEVGDFLGLKEYKTDFLRFSSVAVYPRPLEHTDIPDTLGSIIGDISVRRYIYEDPVLISGFREYTGREPMKTISWLHSARTGRLMVSKYDFTSEASLTVLLDSRCEAGMLEKCFSLARTVCDILEEKGCEYDFFMNSAIGGANCRQHYFAKGMGPRHKKGILRQLAMALDICDYSGEELIRQVVYTGSLARGIIVVCAGRDGKRGAMLSKLAENPAVTVNVLYAEDYTAPGTNDEAPAAGGCTEADADAEREVI